LENFFLKQEYIGTWSRIGMGAIVISLCMSAIIIGFLLQTIRPSKHYLTKISGLPSLESPNIIWPDMKKDEPTKDRFMKKINNWQESDFEQDLKASVFVGHCLAYRKYKTYRLALWLAKIQIPVIFLIFLSFFVSELMSNK
jgi:hypothetical protein